MHSLAPQRRSGLLRALAVATAALLCLIPWADTAAAHGSTIDPMSRNYSCWKRWGHDFQNPNMANQDPMCWQAWQDNPNAMWNWNGLYRDGVNNNHQAAIPDGQLCSGGRAEGGRYRSMDTVGAWEATNIASSANFTVRVHDAALHGATYFQIYVTKQGFDPTTQALKWSDLELVRTTGAYAPGEGTPSTEPQLGGVTVSIDASAPGRTGRHMVYTIWRAGHMDQTYYLCSDVNFG
ncbi:lytic polysaccharide monooxygenase [Streptomyces sp. NPDC059853]|uniref:lytic polysaccharide monooxygenase auxiliary activity family 9 protein n=1 Tax=Streptomyces sp. NPDC059853 TaxID=3346973 RepID=UPI00365916FC